MGKTDKGKKGRMENMLNVRRKKSLEKQRQSWWYEGEAKKNKMERKVEDRDSS